MHKFFKRRKSGRILSAALALTIVLGQTVFASAASGKTEASQKFLNVEGEVLAATDFDGNSVGELISSGNGMTSVTVDKEHGNSRRWNFITGHQHIGAFYPEGLPDGRYKFSFSLRRDSYDNNQFVRIIGADATSITDWSKSYIILRYDGSIQKRTVNASSDWRERLDSFEEFNVNTWYDIDICIDTVFDEMAMYVDGELVGLHKLIDKVAEGFKGVVIRQEIGTQSDNSTYIDNIKFVREADSSCKTFDPVKISASVGDDIVGNNFFNDKMPNFDVEFNNREPKDKTLKVNYRVVSNDGVLVHNSDKEIKIEKNGTFHDALNIPEKYYGRMDLTVTVDDGENVCSKVIPYTLSNHETTMPKNKRLGVAGHIDRGKGDPDETIKLLAYSGLGQYRGEEAKWINGEQQKGVYKLSDKLQGFLDGLCENGIDYTALQVGGRSFYNTDAQERFRGDVPPTTKQGMDGLQSYIREILKVENGDGKQRIKYFEVYNEWQSTSMSQGVSELPEAAKIYTDLNRAMYRGAQEGDPNVKILGIVEDRWGLYNTTMLEDMLREYNKEKVFDYVSLHPYAPSGGGFESETVLKFPYDTKDMLEKYGYDRNTPMVFSELGWADYTIGYDSRKKAALIVRAQAVIQAKNLAEIVHNYNLYDYPENNRVSLQEASFGMVESYNYAGSEVPCLGKDTYTAVSYWNTLMAENEFISTLDGFSDEGHAGYHFKDRNGRDIVMLALTGTEEESIGVDLGTATATYADLNGNETEITGIDGTFSIKLKPNEVYYLIGNFPQIKICEPKIECSASVVQVPIDGTYTISFKTPQGLKAEAACEYGDILKSVESGKSQNGMPQVKFLTNSENSSGAVNVYLKEGDDILYCDKVTVDYTTSATVSDFRFENTTGDPTLWDAVFNVENIRTDKAIDGKIVAEGKSNYVKLPEIAPKEVREIRVPLPKVKNLKEIKGFVGELDLSSGDKVFVNETDNFVFASYTNTPPKIDGDLSDWETNAGTMYLDEKAQVRVIPDWNGMADLSAKANLKYDMQNLYISAEVTDNVYCQPNAADRMWAGDSIQINIGLDPVSNLQATNFTFGRDNTGKSCIYRHTQEGNMGGFEGHAAAILYTDGDISVVTKGNKTYYEVRIPWDKMAFNKVDISKGSVVYFAMIINDDDGNGRRGWICCCDGSASDSKNMVDLYKMYLQK